jgi:hypothetical protein
MTDDPKVAEFSLASFKAAGSGQGEFEALVSVFGNVDLGGDRIVPGAFAKSLARWEESGDPIPVIWNHDWDNPLAHIGAVTSAEETEEGLKVKGRIDTDNAFAAQVHRLLSERRVKEMSFGYNIVDAEQKDGVYELRELDLIEVGPTLKGMNPATQLLAVKSWSQVEAKAGKPLVEALSAEDHAAVKRCEVLLAAQLDADEKAGARLSKETRSAISQAIDLLASLISADTAAEPKSIEAEALGKASEPDADILTQLRILKEQ